MYPDPSDWTSGASNSAWFYDLGSGRQSICQTNGWNFLLTLESDLYARLASPLLSFDGTTVSASDVSVIDPSNPSAGAWSTNLLRALYAVAARDGAPASYLQAISADAASMSISASTLAVAIWIERGRSIDSAGNEVFGVGSPADIRIPDGAMLPTWGVAPARPAQISVGFDCSMQIPPDAVIPAATSVIPFQMDAILVLVVIGVVIVGAAMVASKIPVRPLRNPRTRRRRRN
jgi:hypothetical protein